MITGTLLSRKRYPVHEYVTAISVGVGVAIFMMTSDIESSNKKVQAHTDSNVSDSPK